MNQYRVVFTCKNILRVFQEVVDAESHAEALEIVTQIVQDIGLEIHHVTSIVQL